MKDRLMMHKQLFRPFSLKAVSDTGTFQGYASVFGNIDQGGDIVERGAFKEIVTNSEGRVIVLWQHDTRQPIGTADFKTDDHGFFVDGALVMEDANARRALAHMKAKSVEGMSFGYDVLPGGGEVRESGIRSLTALKMWEVSVVTWGMNPLAGVTSAKALACTSIREFEELLREECGFSHAQAKALASGGWPRLLQARDEQGRQADEEKESTRSILDYLNSIRKGTTK